MVTLYCKAKRNFSVLSLTYSSMFFRSREFSLAGSRQRSQRDTLLLVLRTQTVRFWTAYKNFCIDIKAWCVVFRTSKQPKTTRKHKLQLYSCRKIYSAKTPLSLEADSSWIKLPDENVTGWHFLFLRVWIRIYFY